MCALFVQQCLTSLHTQFATFHLQFNLSRYSGSSYTDGKKKLHKLCCCFFYYLNCRTILKTIPLGDRVTFSDFKIIQPYQCIRGGVHKQKNIKYRLIFIRFAGL